ncbi:MAG: excinuclease ABC subunit UvrA [Patescibacteria group bacterium]
MSKNVIRVKGGRVHNLKNIDVEIPRDKFVVITGLSGSGKSSLAFDTIYAEGQRRYVESLSAYARQFIGLMDKPDTDSIEGLSPAISIDQKSTTHNPRSTVGTVTEIYDYLRLLYARVGTPHCPVCGKKVKKYTIDEISDQIKKDFQDQTVIIFAPLIKDKKGEHKKILDKVAEAGYSRVRFDGHIYSLEELREMSVNPKKSHTLDIVIDKIEINNDKDNMARLDQTMEKGLELGKEVISVALAEEKGGKQKKEKIFSRLFACPECGISLPELEPGHFSFNSPHGACGECGGLGTKLEISPDLIINPNLTVAQGGIKPITQNLAGSMMYLMRIIGDIAGNMDFDLNTQIKNLTDYQLNAILYGTNKKEYQNLSLPEFKGIIPILESRYFGTESEYIRREINKYMRVLKCPSCHGKRLKPEILAVKIDGRSIFDISSLPIHKTKEFFDDLFYSKKMSDKNKKISYQIIKEIQSRLNFLTNVGLDYLTLNRAANTLSGGEAQRIRLATQIGSALMGVLYVLDEPSIGLHQRDLAKLINTLRNLQKLGNTVLVVEHDENIMKAADWIVDVGPGAGKHGGEIVASGTFSHIKKSAKSLTGNYLSGKKSIPLPGKYHRGNGKTLKVINASENNLKNIDVSFPLGKLITITGVSGSGKSSLMTDIVANALSQTFHRARKKAGEYERMEGTKNLDKVICIDQSPIGRTPRSNPATYTGAFTPIRELFASLPEAQIRGYKAGRFSFNVTGGRCEACKGDGMIKIEMQFLPDIYVECEICRGKRYNKEALEITYKGKNIADILDMTVEEAIIFFKNIPNVYQKLSMLNQVGLGYIKLGQSATTLSGGEAQRIKLATELSRRSTGKTLYILDEPTTGLHFDDIKNLLNVLQKLVDKGNTVLIIEHNMDVIKSADWIIDIGPEGGEKGGYIVAEGTPPEVARIESSYTGKYLKKYFDDKRK